MSEIYGNEKKYQRIKVAKNIVVYTFLVIIAVAILFPFYFMLLTAIKSEGQFESVTPILWLSPKDWHLENFRIAWEKNSFGRYMLNTVLVSAIGTTGTVITTILASFAFARLNFKGRDTLFLLLLTTMMIPGELFVITNFITVAKFGWYSTTNQTYTQAVAAMSIPFMTSVFYVYYLRQTFKQIPNELYYAAKVDGTSDFKYLIKVMIPISISTITTITILNAMGTWNAYVWPSLVTNKTNYRLVTNGLRDGSFTNEAGITIYPLQMAAATIVTMPLIFVFLLLKKYIMRGVSRSGIKG